MSTTQLLQPDGLNVAVADFGTLMLFMVHVAKLLPFPDVVSQLPVQVAVDPEFAVAVSVAEAKVAAPVFVVG